MWELQILLNAGTENSCEAEREGDGQIEEVQLEKVTEG